jgi:hypothetical protein
LEALEANGDGDPVPASEALEANGDDDRVRGIQRELEV